MLYILQTALQLGCIYSLVSLALLLSYRILDISDLTTDGCFVRGMAVSVAFCAMDHPFAGLILAVLAGGCAGLVTAFLQTHMGIPSIIAGIITNTGLYTVNLAVMGFSSSISLLKSETVFTKFLALGIGGRWYSIILAAFASLLCMAVLRWFLETRLGLSIRATGDNPDMVSASSIDPRRMIMIGLFLSNCMTALAGGIAGQLQKSADINAGTGIVVVGLACLIIGETAVGGRKSLSRNIIACLAGNIIYRMIYAVILQTRILPIECLKLMTAVIVALAISAPYLQAQRQLKQKAQRRASNA